ncbi:MAG: acyltransferase [Sphingomonas sp.]|uniref:acyltransferase family protein n=1 Tax=Sphingomonas sp. TaxID=28214 RepID=UPI0025E4E58C|nr:acyltransferase [Sphingomonas sp.]MBX3565267.1 acyltransferase [Sphingomonas sp.]
MHPTPTSRDRRGCKPFFTNRLLRLYPALYFCFAATVLSVYLSGYFNTAFSPRQFAIWGVTSLTFFQFYNPDFLRGYDVGAINGSLWTIAVELQFYMLAPILYFALNRYRKLVGIAFVLFVAANMVNTIYNDKESPAWKLYAVSFIPWFYMFIGGAYLSADAALYERILKGHPLLYLVAYLVTYAPSAWLELGTNNDVNVVCYALLVAFIFRVAFYKRELSNNILHGNDVSYGVYIYHMPIVNLLLYLGLQDAYAYLWLALTATAAIAIFSWFCIEKPSLKLKKISLRRHV